MDIMLKTETIGSQNSKDDIQYSDVSVKHQVPYCTCIKISDTLLFYFIKILDMGCYTVFQI